MKILIAEDNALIAQGLQELLGQEGYQCTLCENGEQALQQFKVQKPDLVLLDIMMPEKDGYTVCREIRQQDQMIPIIFLTAKSTEIDQVVGLELGADDYIMKPFGTKEIVARIRAVMRRHEKNITQVKTESEDFYMHDLIIHPSQLRAERDGQMIELGVRDVQILQVLFQHQNKVVSRDELFNQCWGRNYLASSRTLDQHIATLRKIIEVDVKNPQIIKTVHGVGYRYEE